MEVDSITDVNVFVKHANLAYSNKEDIVIPNVMILDFLDFFGVKLREEIREEVLEEEGDKFEKEREEAKDDAYAEGYENGYRQGYDDGESGAAYDDCAF